MDYQIKLKKAKHGSTDREIFKAITEFQTSGISTDDFCGCTELMNRYSKAGIENTTR